MTLLYDTQARSPVEEIPSGAVFALGHFDGVHLGHRSILEAARTMAGNSPSRVVCWTLSGLGKGGCLTTPDEKLRLFAASGADYAVFDEFADIRTLAGEEFFRTHLLEPYQPSGVVCGFNFTFGCGAACHAEDLARFSEAAGIPCAVCPPYAIDGAPVSSTEIRRLIAEGDMEDAAKLLGRPYFLSGPVVRGQGIGHTLGFPTLNLRPAPGKLLPPRGVYASLFDFSVSGKAFSVPGVSNLGSRPTVGGDPDDVTLETHRLPGLPADPRDGEPVRLTGSFAAVRLLSYLRPERKFPSTDALRAAIEEDKSRARSILSSEIRQDETLF